MFEVLSYRFAQGVTKVFDIWINHDWNVKFFKLSQMISMAGFATDVNLRPSTDVMIGII